MKDDLTMCMKTQAWMTRSLSDNELFSIRIHAFRHKSARKTAGAETNPRRVAREEQKRNPREQGMGVPTASPLATEEH
jgi:hypothetical protein